MGEEGKGLLRSTAVQGGFLAILPSIIQILELTGVAPPGVLPTVVSGAMGVVGGLMAIWGRIRATKKIVGIF